MFLSDYSAGSSEYGLETTIVSEYIDDDSVGYAHGPERGLFAAILFDGIQSFMNYVNAENVANRNRYKEAYNWVIKRGDDYIFSFENVCDALGVNSEYFRLGLLNVANSSYKAVKKTRRNF